MSLSTDDPPILTALAAGHVTITAGAASAHVTVFAGPLPLGTVIWSNPGDGSGVQSIVPAVPSTSGVADVFAFQADGTVQAITSDGTVAWTAPTNYGYGIPDFQGGLVVVDLNVDTSNGSPVSSIMKLDGTTGQPYPAYTAAGEWYCPGDDGFVVHPDGTIITLQCLEPGTPSVIGIDPITGGQKFSAPINGLEVAYGPIVAGDGYAYFPYSYITNRGDSPVIRQLAVLRVDSSGDYSNIDVSNYVSTYDHTLSLGAAMITNADQGILLTWWLGGSGMATITGGTVSLVSPPQLPGGGQVYPVLQAQDGSFVGTDCPGCALGYGNMASFDATVNTRWVVPGDQPQIATADGGVIGQSGITYDQNGNATGQINLATQSWLANAYQLGPVNHVVAAQPYVATTWWPFVGANVSASGTAAQQPWFEPLQGCGAGSTPCLPQADTSNDEAIFKPRDSQPAPLPSCPGGSTPCAQEAIVSALGALRTLVQGPCPGCNNWVFPGLPGYSQSGFSNYLSLKPRFWDGTRSYVAIDIALCPSGFFSKYLTCAFAGRGTTVHDYLGESEAVSQTPSDAGKGMQVFFNPATGICNRLSLPNPQPGDQGVLNQAVLFHEALHGYTGQEDNTLETDFGLPPTIGESVSITYYLEGKVIPGGASGAAACAN